MSRQAPPAFVAAMQDHNNARQNKVDDEEDDYMSMVIEEPKAQRETLTQRKLRKQRESEAKARVPSKAEREAAEAERRNAALSKSALDPSSKGYQMMAKLGYKPGSALGKPEAEDTAKKNPASTADEQWNSMRARLTEPLGITVKEDRGGIGLDAEKKRKFREEVETETKRAKAEVGDYRERVRLEREERRKEAQFHAAQKVAERLDIEAEEQSGQAENGKEQPHGETETAKDDQYAEKSTDKPKRNLKPLSKVNILYRGLVRSREEKLRDLQANQRRYASLSREPNRFSDMSRLPTYDDSSLDPDDKLALSRTDEGTIAEVELEQDEEDEELEKFNELSAEERLSRVVSYLREKYHYCFWCKYRYETAEMDGCPGLTEEDHD